MTVRSMAPVRRKSLNEEFGFLEGNADCREDNGEVTGVVAQHLGLTGDLSSQFGVGQTGAGEDRQLLTANQSVQSVNGRNAGLNELGRIVHGLPGSWADR